MLPIIKDRREELGIRFDKVQDEIFANSHPYYFGRANDHKVEVTTLQEEQDEIYARLNELMSLGPEMDSDDKNIVRKYLNWRLNFLREIDKNSTRPDRAKIRAAGIDEVTKLLEAIDTEGE